MNASRQIWLQPRCLHIWQNFRSHVNLCSVLLAPKSTRTRTTYYLVACRKNVAWLAPCLVTRLSRLLLALWNAGIYPLWIAISDTCRRRCRSLALSFFPRFLLLKIADAWSAVKIADCAQLGNANSIPKPTSKCRCCGRHACKVLGRAQWPQNALETEWTEKTITTSSQPHT